MNLTDAQLDVLKQLINVGVEQAAEILNAMIPSQVHMQVPLVQPISSDEEAKQLNKQEQVTVQLGFHGALNGAGTLVLPAQSAGKLTTALTDEAATSTGFAQLQSEAITEVGNIVINGVMGSIGNTVQQKIEYSVPEYNDGTDGGNAFVLPQETPDMMDLMARTHFMVEQLEIEGDIVLSFVANSFDSLLAVLDSVSADLGVSA